VSELLTRQCAAVPRDGEYTHSDRFAVSEFYLDGTTAELIEHVASYQEDRLFVIRK